MRLLRPSFVGLLVLASCLVSGGVMLLSGNAAESPAAPPKPFGLKERIPLTTSRVVGAPEPPPPLRAEKVFEKIKLEHPLYVTELPGTHDLLVIQQDGKILRFENRPDVEKAEVWLDVGQDTYGLGFHPKFAENGQMFVLSNGLRGKLDKDDKKKRNRLSRYTVNRTAPFACDPKSELVILEWLSDGHNGGEPCFGPDGMLYCPAGDGTSDSDTDDTGQDLKDLNAVMIRIDVDHPDPGKTYSVPKDNPFISTPGARPEIWAFGFRNPWRATFDKKTGHLWVGNIGQDQWEMVHIVKKGENYGWAAFEGGHPFHELRKVGPTPPVKPTIEHPHSEARSITGGPVYYGAMFPEYQGCYLYGDYSTGKIWAAKHDGETLRFHEEIADTTAQILGFCEDWQGNILLVDYAGALWKLVRSPKVENPPVFPTKLSETGLFTSVAGHQVQPGLIPYDVNSPLWSDGAFKERFIAVPGEGKPTDGKIEYKPTNGFAFPDLSVLVKTFSLELEAGNPSSRRRIETRLMTKQQGEWVGYSYLWNDEQTDALLVDKRGIDKTFTIKDAKAEGGTRQQTWHYPSRAECMVCHSRAASYVLGLSSLQFNRDFDYGGVVDNQLRSLHHIGLLTGWSAEKPKVEPPKEGPAIAEIPDPPDRLVNPYDKTANLEMRVRSYLHANCAICHVDAGGGNSRMLLDFATHRQKMVILDAKPQHHSFDIAEARVIAPGAPERSVMLQRLSRRGQGQMPPLASSIPDEQAILLFREWIQSLK